MALAFSTLQEFYDTNSSSATTITTTANISPTASSLLIVFVGAASGEATETDPSAVSLSGGVSFTKLSTTSFNSTNNNAITCWVANSGASPGANQSLSVGSWTLARTGVGIVTIQVTGADLSGAASDAIIQPQGTSGTAATSGSMTLSAASDSNNRPVAFFVHNANQTSTARTNWTLAGTSGGHNTPVRGYMGEWRADAFETTASASWTTSAVWNGYCLEVKIAAAATPVRTPPLITQTMTNAVKRVSFY